MASGIQRDEITRILTGTVVRSVGRAADMGVVEFDGPQGETTAMIHMQCPFRIVRHGRILLGSADMRYAQKGTGRDAFDEVRMVYDAQTATFNRVLGQLRPRVDGVTVGEIEAWRAFTGGAHYGFPPETI